MVVPRDLGNGIISSQVFNFAEALSKSREVTLIIKDELLSHEKLNNLGIPAIGYSQKKLIDAALKNAEWVYLRSPLMFLRFFIYRKRKSFSFKLFYDFRGLVHEESFMRNRNKIRRYVLFQLEKFAYKYADYVGAVSVNMKNVIENLFRSKSRVYVTPCCISEVKGKNKSGGKGEINFVYVGGLSSWQCFDEILKLYRSISNNIPSTLTIISKQIELAKLKVKDAQVTEVEYKTMSQQEVTKDLINYDFGFLLRENILLNRVASPIKFLEYTSSGVIPIISRNVGDFSEEVVKNKIGIVLDNNNEFNYCELLRLRDDAEIYGKLKSFSEKYTWDNYVSNHPLVKKV